MMHRIAVGLVAAALVAGPGMTSAAESKGMTIGSLVTTIGTQDVKVQGIGLVVGLDDTGADPDPSPLRVMLVDEMKKRGVTTQDAEKIFRSKKVALVIVQGALPAGVRKGDHFDLEVEAPGKANVTSLHGGWLLETRMVQLGATTKGQILPGQVLARAEGPLLVAPQSQTGINLAQARRARIPGGGESKMDRELGLVLTGGNRSARIAALIGEQINNRFHDFDHGETKGMATPKTDQLIALRVPAIYRYNLVRYLQVIRNLPLESTEPDAVRLDHAGQLLLDPRSAGLAAIRLEGIGPAAIPALRAGLAHASVRVRFFSAEALAYLDDPAAARPLRAIADHRPAFKAHALAALAAMDDGSAHDELVELMSSPSLETRYGAFRALRGLDPRDPILGTEPFHRLMTLHTIHTQGEPMIHISTRDRCEIVLFGRGQRLVPPLTLHAGPHILITADDAADQLRVARIAVRRADGQVDDRRDQCSTDLADAIRAVMRLGGTYPDVVEMLFDAQKIGCLKSRLAVDAQPEDGVEYVRALANLGGGRANLFSARPAPVRPAKPVVAATPPTPPKASPAENAQARPSFFNRLFGRSAN